MQKKLAAVQIPAKVISFEYLNTGELKAHVVVVFQTKSKTVAWDKDGGLPLGGVALYGLIFTLISNGTCQPILSILIRIGPLFC